MPITQTEKPPAAYQKRAAAVTFNLDRYLEFSQLSKVYPTPAGPLTVVENFDLKVRKGEFISVIGHSGCGKSTVLSMTAGLNEVSLGGIILDGREVTAAGPDRAVVFQAPSLFPWLTARENVALGVDRVYPHATRRQRDEIVDYYLERVGLADLFDKPAAADVERDASACRNCARLRAVAEAAAARRTVRYARQPHLVGTCRKFLMEVWKRTQVTAMCVTHDVDEAILLADRVVMMTNGPNARIGHIMEVDIPLAAHAQDLLEHPDYYRYRRELLDFLEAYEHGAAPKPSAAAPAASPEAA
ncbi:ABC transporter ATP-binding protein [Bradyrhizobium betae]